jgi:hypothetical protein
MLSDNQISNSGAQAIAAALKVNCSLRSLSLAGNLSQCFSHPFVDNGIGVTGGEALADALKVNQSLEILWLGGIDSENSFFSW